MRTKDGFYTPDIIEDSSLRRNKFRNRLIAVILFLIPLIYWTLVYVFDRTYPNEYERIKIALLGLWFAVFVICFLGGGIFWNKHKYVNRGT